MTYQASATTPDRTGVTTDRILAWLTVERLAWIVIGVAAAAVRLAGLGARVFDPAEAQQAVSALGAASLPAPGISPLLLSLQRVGFVLLDSNELMARVWPALAGVALVLLAYELRAELGRVGALGAGVLLAVSPLLVYWSRSATGESFALLAAMLLIVALSRARRGERWVVWGAVGLALLVLSSPAGYGVLILIAPMAVLALAGRRSDDDRASADRSQWLTGLLVFVGLVALGATAMFFNPAGFAAVADLPAAWLRGLTASAGFSPLPLAVQLALGELLALAAGIAGLVIGLRRRDWFAQALGLWLVLALVLLFLRSGRTPVDAALLALPLALLAGIAIEAFVARVSLSGQEAEAAVLLLACLVVLGAAAIWLADYARTLDGIPSSVFLFSAGAALVVLLAILLAYAVVFGTHVTWQVAVLVAAIVLGLLTVRMTALTSFNHDPLRWGSVANTRGATDGPNLTAFLEQLAGQRGTDLRDLPVTLVAAPGSEPSPLLRWLVRDAATGQAADEASGRVLDQSG
ncbi:MAG: glycosyltransferase family 39 protein [Caldilineales bacterium]